MDVAAYGRMALELREVYGHALTMPSKLFEPRSIHASESFIPCMLFSLLSEDQIRESSNKGVRINYLGLPSLLKDKLAEIVLESESSIERPFSDSMNLLLTTRFEDVWCLPSALDENELIEVMPYIVASRIYEAKESGRDYYSEPHFHSARKMIIDLEIRGFREGPLGSDSEYLWKIAGSSPVRLSQLPKAFQDEVAASLKEMEEPDEP